MRIFTIGTAHRTHFDFARLLGKYGIEVLFDVRRTPEAREDHFRRDGLQALAAGQGVDYIFMGNELGGPREDVYGDWTASDEFRRGIDIIRGKASKRVCCVLCAERTPENCHRRVIAEHLARHDFEVVHILDETTTWSPPPPRPVTAAPRPAQRTPHPPRGRWRGRGSR
jgi:uncharacterized protein (DUF488 family)